MQNMCGVCGADNSTESRMYTQYKIIIEVYIVFVLCLAGIMGNTLSILVLGKDRTMRRTTAYLLQMVGVADTLYLTTCIFYQTVNTMDKHTDWIPSLRYIWPYFEPYVWPCASIAQTCTVWLVLVLTADRYVAICKPLQAPLYSTTSRMRKLVICIYLFSILYNVPRFFERMVQLEYDEHHNISIPCVVKSKLRCNAYYIIIYKTGAFFVLRFLIPLSLLAFFNTKLIQAIRQSSQINKIKGCSKGSPYDLYTSSERGAGRRRRDRQQHTQILVVVVLVFILFEMPDFFLRIYISLNKYFPLERKYLLYVNVLSNLCLTLNSCANFLIYCFLGRKFRYILGTMFCKKKHKVRSHCKMLMMNSGSNRSVVLQTEGPTQALLVNGSSSRGHLYD